MATNSKQNWKLATGLLAGLGLGLWLNSQQGRRVRKQTQKNVKAYGERATNYVKEQAHHLGENVQHLFEQGKAKMSQEVQHEDGKPVQPTLERGYQRARRKMSEVAE